MLLQVDDSIQGGVGLDLDSGVAQSHDNIASAGIFDADQFGLATGQGSVLHPRFLYELCEVVYTLA